MWHEITELGFEWLFCMVGVRRMVCCLHFCGLQIGWTKIKNIFRISSIELMLVNRQWSWRFIKFRNSRHESLLLVTEVFEFSSYCFLKIFQDGIEDVGVFFWKLSSSASCKSSAIFDVVRLKNPWVGELSVVIFSRSLYLIEEDLRNFRTKSKTFCTSRKVGKCIAHWVRI